VQAAPCNDADNDGVFSDVDPDDNDPCNPSTTVPACLAPLFCDSNPCNDGVSCTVDTCDEDTDTCDNTPDDTLCDDGTFCNGSETCDAVLDCQSGTAPDCSDGNVCTVDLCDETTDTCDNPNVPDIPPTPCGNPLTCFDGLCGGAEPVGGISIPIDNSALLLAVVSSISMWMIPVVIASVGIGVFVIKRRK